MFQWYQRSIQDAEINAKNSEKENMTIRSTQFLLHENVCIPLGYIKGYDKTLPQSQR